MLFRIIAFSRRSWQDVNHLGVNVKPGCCRHLHYLYLFYAELFEYPMFLTLMARKFFKIGTWKFADNPNLKVHRKLDQIEDMRDSSQIHLLNLCFNWFLKHNFSNVAEKFHWFIDIKIKIGKKTSSVNHITCDTWSLFTKMFLFKNVSCSRSRFLLLLLWLVCVWS